VCCCCYYYYAKYHSSAHSAKVCLASSPATSSGSLLWVGSPDSGTGTAHLSAEFGFPHLASIAARNIFSFSS